MYAILYDPEDFRGRCYVLIDTVENSHTGWTVNIQESIDKYRDPDYKRTPLSKGFKVEKLGYPVLVQSDNLDELQTLALLKGH